jgi:hypothetical protein
MKINPKIEDSYYYSYNYKKNHPRKFGMAQFVFIRTIIFYANKTPTSVFIARNA